MQKVLYIKYSLFFSIIYIEKNKKINLWNKTSCSLGILYYKK